MWRVIILCCGIFWGLNLVKAQISVDSSQYPYNTHEGIPYMNGNIEPVLITAKKPTARQLKKGRKKLQKLTRLRWNVHKVYPYALKVADILEGVEDTLQMMSVKEDQKKYLKNREKSLFGSYEQDLRKMSRSQGKVLVKLISRETGNSSFDLIKNYKNGASAFLWQSIGLIFGISLKVEYEPEEEEMIEWFVQDLERGGYNIAYKKYAYVLP